uniref:mucin-5AC-like n=1 Tax=Styela clava TaxID=7725 RepID=UPI00193AC153|nr:mucin-5AC-like [Styela clava]
MTKESAWCRSTGGNFADAVKKMGHLSVGVSRYLEDEQPTVSSSTTTATLATMADATLTTEESFTTSTPTTSNPCGAGGFPNGRRFLFDVTSCVQYYFECVHDIYIQRQCTAGTKFDVKSTTCNWERNIAACQDEEPTVSSSSTTTATSDSTSIPTTANPCGAGGSPNGKRFLFDDTSCVQYYYECVHDKQITVTVADPHSSTTTATSAPTTSTTVTTKEPTSPPPDLESCTEAQRQYVTMFREWQQAMDDWCTLMDEYDPCP